MFELSESRQVPLSTLAELIALVDALGSGTLNEHQRQTLQALRDELGLTINQAIASVAADYLVRLLLTNNLDKFQTYIDLNSLSMQSTTITPANVDKLRRR
jgi:hypothetical protein